MLFFSRIVNICDGIFRLFEIHAVLRHENILTGYLETRALFQYGGQSLNSVARLVIFVCEFGLRNVEFMILKHISPSYWNFATLQQFSLEDMTLICRLQKKC